MLINCLAIIQYIHNLKTFVCDTYVYFYYSTCKKKRGWTSIVMVTKLQNHWAGCNSLCL